MNIWKTLNGIIGIIIIISIVLELFGIGRYDLTRLFFMFLFSLIVIEFQDLKNSQETSRRKKNK